MSVTATSSRWGAAGVHQMKKGFFDLPSLRTSRVVILPVTSGEYSRGLLSPQ